MKTERLVILGGGESGVGAAILGKDKGFDVFLSDKGTLKQEYIAKLELEQIAYEQGGHDLSKILNADLVVKSPGIPDKNEVILALKELGTEIISEIEFAGRYTDAMMCCITGSNGKTTTTLLLYHLLKTAGLDVGLAGNVGYSLAEQVARNPHPCYVIELSSFQLDGMFTFHPHIGIVTNVTPDHLDRYDYKFENYLASKFSILNNMDAKDLFIYDVDNDASAQYMNGRGIVPEVATISYSETDASAYVKEGKLIVTYGTRKYSIATAEITIQGRHNMYNAMCAILSAMKLNISDDKITEGLRTFPQVEHRLEFVVERNGVRYINDSKATNVDSAWYALDSMQTPVIWIAGGTDKGNDYSVLNDLVKAKVKVLVCMGVDNTKLIESFKNVCTVEDCHSLEETVACANHYATTGDTVLLSPCCASFDLFKSYEDRGRRFKEAVKK
ncbi:MAG: UDP-N-acetylmuramoyl-L-alanine--D-glutamate ligase [Marinifilaceae bacterium]